MPAVGDGTAVTYTADDLISGRIGLPEVLGLTQQAALPLATQYIRERRKRASNGTLDDRADPTTIAELLRAAGEHRALCRAVDTGRIDVLVLLFVLDDTTGTLLYRALSPNPCQPQPIGSLFNAVRNLNINCTLAVNLADQIRSSDGTLAPACRARHLSAVIEATDIDDESAAAIWLLLAEAFDASDWTSPRRLPDAMHEAWRSAVAIVAPRLSGPKADAFHAAAAAATGPGPARNGHELIAEPPDPTLTEDAAAAIAAVLTPVQAQRVVHAHRARINRQQHDLRTSKRGQRVSYEGHGDPRWIAMLYRRADPTRALAQAVEYGLVDAAAHLRDLSWPDQTSLWVSLRWWQRMAFTKEGADGAAVRWAYDAGARLKLSVHDLTLFRSSEGLSVWPRVNVAPLTAFLTDPEIDVETAAALWIIMAATYSPDYWPEPRRLPERLHEAWSACVGWAVEYRQSDDQWVMAILARSALAVG